MLAEPNRTPYDLSWEMFGIPVRIHPMFWLVAVVLGWNFASAYGLKYLLVWVLCMFVSILVHELGHVFMGRVFGASSQIVLYGFGGLAIGSLYVRGPWRRIAVLLAGPGAGFLLYAAVLVLVLFAAPTLAPFLDPAEWPNPVASAIRFLLWMNLVWNLFNLLPIFPLDGGQICAELLKRVQGELAGLKTALALSIALALLLAFGAFFPDRVPVDIPLIGHSRQPLLGIMLLLIAFENMQIFSQLNDRRGGWE
jgi:Zn-dependent protease